MPPQSLQELVVFLASPSDCETEREAVRAAAEAVTDAFAATGLRIRVTGWEHQAPDVGRPQAQINPRVDSCDVFIGLLKRRWGTTSGTHSSGFLEEFERALERRDVEEPGPRIALWFSLLSDDTTSDPGPQLREVLQFQKRIREQRIALHGTFSGVDDLKVKVVDYLVRLAVERTHEPHPAEGSGSAEDVRAERTELTDAPIDEAREQIARTTDAVSKFARGEKVADGSPFSADRLLLIALGLLRDHEPLPVHATNRLFRRRTDLRLSEMEMDVWLRTILSSVGSGAGAAYRVVPGWAVTAPDGWNTELVERLTSYTQNQDPAVARGALIALQAANERPNSLWRFGETDREQVLDRWKIVLASSASGAAKSYLATVATPDDEPLIEAMVVATDDEDLAQLLGAWRDETASLVESVAKSYTSIDWKTRLVEQRILDLPPAALNDLVAGRNTPVAIRAIALDTLLNGEGATKAALESALKQPELHARLFAALDSGALDVGAVRAALENLDTDDASRDLKARVSAYEVQRAVLLDRVRTPGAESLNAWESLSWRPGPDLVDMARTVFDSDGHDLVAPFEAVENWDDKESVIKFVRCMVRIAALRVLAAQDSPASEDVERIEREATAGEPTYARSEAVELLIGVALPEHLTVLTEALDRVYGEAKCRLLTAVLELGHQDVARELLARDDHTARMAAIAWLTNDPSTPIEALEEQLFHDDQGVRLEAALALTQRLDSDEISKLLDSYPTERATYYYNVVCAFDWHLFGPRAEAEPES